MRGMMWHAQAAAAALYVCLLLDVLPAEGASVRGGLRALATTSTRRDATYSVISSGVCRSTSGCEPVADDTECTKAFKQLLSAGEVETDADYEALQRQGMFRRLLNTAISAKHSVASAARIESGLYQASRDDIGMPNSINSECLQAPSACIYRRERTDKRLWWNSCASTVPATASEGVVCKCGNALLKEDSRYSMTGKCRGFEEWSLNQKDTFFNVYNTYSAGSVGKVQQDDREATEPVAVELLLNCASGTSFDGTSSGATRLDVSCDPDTGITTMTLQPSGAVLDPAATPACQRMSCAADSLELAAASGHHGLWKASYTQVPETPLLDGDHPTVKCANGYTRGGFEPTIDNTKFGFVCRSGSIFLESRIDNVGVVTGINSEVLGAYCEPVRCPTTDPIFLDAAHANQIGDSVFEAHMDVGCKDGWVLCDGVPVEKSTFCPPVHIKLATVGATCTAEATWSEPAAFTSLSCRPRECAAIVVADNSGTISTVKSLETEEYYTYHPQGDKKTVSVTCAEGYSFDGEKDGLQEGDFACGGVGLMELTDADQMEGAPAVGADESICKPITCDAVAIQGEDDLVTPGHKSKVTLSCGPGTSFDGSGRHSAETYSNYEQLLVCESGTYRCESGWCTTRDTVDTSRGCMEIMCKAPSREAFTANMFDDHKQHAGQLFLVGNPYSVQCRPGYWLPETQALEFESVCGAEWQSPASGWGTELPKCQMIQEFCAPTISEGEWPLHGLAEIAYGGASIGSMATARCLEYYRLRTSVGGSIEREQKSGCFADEKNRGVWTEPILGCTRIQCEALPSSELMGAVTVSGVQESCQPTESACVFAGNEFTYSCGEGHRWSFDAGDSMVLASADKDLKMLCTDGGDWSFSDQTKQNVPRAGDGMPICIALACAEPSQGPMQGLLASDSLDDKGRHVASMVRMTYEWERRTGDPKGRRFSETSYFRCLDGGAYEMRCGANGNFEVKLGNLYTDLSLSLTGLLNRCGKQLRVTPLRDRQPLGQAQCLTAMDGGGVQITSCAKATLQQMWWFESRSEECADNTKSTTVGDVTYDLHKFSHCGQLRSMQPGAQHLCLQGPAEDVHGAGAQLAPCEEKGGGTVWLMDSANNAMRFRTADKSFRRHVFAFAQPEGQSDMRLAFSELFEPTLQHGFAWTAPGSHDNDVAVSIGGVSGLGDVSPDVISD